MSDKALLTRIAAPVMTPALLRLLRGVSRSFYLSIRFLPGPLRGPIAIGYLLARATDTVADTTALPQAERQALLAQLLTAIHTPRTEAPELQTALACFADQQSDPHERALMRAWPDALQLLQALPADDQASVRWVLGHITRGQTLDVSRFGDGPQALTTEAELEDYTWLVAGCVGEFWTELCARHLPSFANLPTDEMHALGRAYGMGLQRLNIVRDAGADLTQGRCYWPTERLSVLGLTPESLTQAVHEARTTLAQLTPLYQAYLQQIQTQLAAGLRYSCAVQSRRLRLASALPALIGARTVALLLQAGPSSLCQRIKMPRREVQALLCRLLLRGVSEKALKREFERLSAPPSPQPVTEQQCENPTP